MFLNFLKMFFITYLFLASGISIIITQSTIFESLRNAVERRSPFFGEGLNCPMCTGFWAGIFLSFLGISPAHLYIFPLLVPNLMPADFLYYFMHFSNGAIAAMLSWGYYNLIAFLQHKHIYDLIGNPNEGELEGEGVLND